MKRTSPSASKGARALSGARAKASTGKTSPAAVSGVTSPARLTSPGARASPSSRALTSPSRPSKIPSLVRTGGKTTPTPPLPTTQETDSGHVTEETYREEPIRSPGKVGIRYISLELIKKIAKEENVNQIKKLNLTLSKEGGKKIKYIEHLDHCKNLEVLSLSCNMIEKMEKLDKLTKLKELNLSFNNIQKIEGIDNLVSLQILNLNGNQLTTIPAFVGKKLKALRILRLARNQLDTLNELSKLRPLNDLTQLSIQENPLSSLPHSRAYTVFYLRSLQMLDSQMITPEEREDAEKRFSQDEVEGLEKKLEANESKLRKLESQLGKTESEKQAAEEEKKGEQERHLAAAEELEKLRNELATKDELLRKKTGELMRASEKHYQLEQDLAFQKLDDKFENLGKAPIHEGSDADDEGLDESPYIGRARFKPNQYAYASHHDPAQPIRFISPERAGQSAAGLGGTGQSQRGVLSEGLVTPESSPEIRIVSPEVEGLGQTGRDLKNMHAELDHELAMKSKKIKRAEDRLTNLEEILRDTEQQVDHARDELSRLSRTSGATPNADRKLKEDMMGQKVSLVKQLQQNARKLEDEMKRTEEDVVDDQVELDALREKLAGMDTQDTRYKQVHAEVADKEAQISYNNEVYEDLQNQLDRMLERIAKETEDIKRLEEELREGQATQNEELKAELEEIISGLQDYLTNVRRQADAQKVDYQELVREKESLSRRMKDMETEITALENEAGDYKELQKRLAEMEDSLVDQQAMNSSLRAQLQQIASPAAEPGLEHKLDEAEEEIADLRQALRDLKKQNKRDLEELTSELEEERDRRRKDVDQEKHAVDDVARKLDRIKEENEKLRLELDSREDKLRDVIPTEDLDGQIRDMLGAMEEGKPYRPDAKTSRTVGRTLTELQRFMEDKFEESQAEVENKEREKRKLEEEVSALRNKLARTERATSPHHYSTTSAASMPHDQQLKRMQGEIDDLKKLFREQEKKRGSIPHVRATPRSYYSDTGGESEGPGGAGGVGGVLLRRSRGVGSPQRSARSGGGGGIFGNEGRDGYYGGGGDGGGNGGGDRGRRNSRHSYMDPEDEEQALLNEIAEEILGLQSKMRDADRLSAQQLGAAFAQMKALEEEIKRKEAEIKDERLKRKQFEDEQLQAAADDLSALQEEVEQLQAQLETKETEIQEENKKVSHNNQTIAAQGEEIDYLHDVLGAQKGEIKRLHDLIEKMTSQHSAPGKEHDDEMKKLQKEVEKLKSSLSQQGSMIQAFGPTTFPMTSQMMTQQVPMTSQVPMTMAPPPPVAMAPPQPVAMAQPQPTVAMAQPQAAVGMATSGVAMTSPVRYYSTPYQPAVFQQGSPGDGDPGQGSPVYAPQQYSAGYPHAPAYPQPPHYPQPGQQQQQQGSGPAAPDVSPIKGESPLKRMLRGEDGDDLMVCNVPEHHELEDLVAQLQKKVKKMRKEIREKDKRIAEADAEGTRAVNRLTDELQNKHEELENLDLAIERQKSSLTQLKEAERKVEQEKDAALKVLQELKTENEKITRRRDFLSGRTHVEMEDGDYEYDYDPRSLQSRQNYIREELPCLEETLAKRKAELRESDRLLKECEADLQAAKQEAKDTIQRYDEARSHYDQVCRDSEELERRARDNGLQVIRSNDEIKTLKTEIDQLQAIKSELEQTVREINQVITSKDEEFNSLDSMYKETATRLQRMQNDYRITEEKEHEKTENIKRAEQEVVERRAELDRLRMQIESERCEMEAVDKEMGRMRTEHHLLRATVEEKQNELRALERDLEKELTMKQREIKELRATIDELHTQKSDLFGALQARRDELQKTQYEIEREEQGLHQMTSSIGKHKAELKHVLEMLQMEQTELNRMNDQHKSKLSQLEKTQSALQEEKTELDKIQEERKRHQMELDHLREVYDTEKLGIERQETERKALDANINVLTKEKEILDENCNSLETKIASQKRNLLQIEDSIHSNKSKLSKLESDVNRSQLDMEDIRQEKATLNDDVQILNQHVSDGKSELRSLRDSIKTAEDHIHQLEQDLKTKAREKETIGAEVQRLDGEISQRRAMCEEWSRQEKQKRDEMDVTQRQLDKVTCECNEAKKAFHRVSLELEKEEAKLNRIISNAQLELENLKTDLALKHDQLEESANKLNMLKKEAEQRQLTKERVQELEKQIQEKEKELETQHEEKKQVSGALNRAYRELQTLRDDFNQERDSKKTQVKHFEDDIDDLKQQLLDSMRELKACKKKTSAEIKDLERVAQDHCARANRLSDELNAVRQEYLNVKQQLYSQAELLARDRRLEDSLLEIKTDLQDANSPTADHKVIKSLELDEMTSQKHQIQRHLDELKENLAAVRAPHLSQGEHDTTGEFPSYNDSWRREAFRDKFTHEQDYLKQQLRHQMSRHAETLQNERQKSEGTLLNLKRRLNNLEDVLSNSDLTRSRQSLLARSPLVELNSSDTQDDPGVTPIYSPSKSYTMNRPHSRTRSWDKIPQRGPPTPNTSFYSTS